ncbi:MAG: barstar family protein [Betaproteobacteria bacterium]|nr:barstar family protein [Betaproteobacteria bacterium]
MAGMQGAMKGAGRSGVYLAPAAIDPVRRAADEARLAWLDLDLAHVADKRAFLAACARQLGFPQWFGANWDALADCLGDFSWRPAPGYVVCWRDCARLGREAPDVLATALEIFDNAAMFWKEHGKAFIVLLDAEPGGGLRLRPFAVQ